jgi:hypothetical protein
MEGKIQVVQLRRILLLFALVLGLSAVVAALVPPPEPRREESSEPPALRTPSVSPGNVSRTRNLRFTVPAADASAGPPLQTAVVTAGSSVNIEVSVPEPGEVELEGLGLREPADAVTPARFELFARQGRFAVVFFPLTGERRVGGRLEFELPPR